jgi:hypothetical protein
MEINKQKLFTLLYILLIVCVIISCVLLIIFLKSESATCMADPINYFSEKTGQLCYCLDKIG